MEEFVTRELFDFAVKKNEVQTDPPVQIPKEEPVETYTPSYNPMDPLPAPSVCPCRVVSGFICPAKKEGRVREYCVGGGYTSCSNYSAWWHYKRAEVEAKMKKRK